MIFYIGKPSASRATDNLEYELIFPERIHKHRSKRDLSTKWDVRVNFTFLRICRVRPGDVKSVKCAFNTPGQTGDLVRKPQCPRSWQGLSFVTHGLGYGGTKDLKNPDFSSILWPLLELFCLKFRISRVRNWITTIFTTLRGWGWN